MFAANPILPAHHLRSENANECRTNVNSVWLWANDFAKLPFAMSSNSSPNTSDASNRETLLAAPTQFHSDSNPISAHFSAHPNCWRPISVSYSTINSTLSNFPLRAKRSLEKRLWNSRTDQVSPELMHPVLQPKNRIEWKAKIIRFAHRIQNTAANIPQTHRCSVESIDFQSNKSLSGPSVRQMIHRQFQRFDCIADQFVRVMVERQMLPFVQRLHKETPKTKSRRLMWVLTNNGWASPLAKSNYQCYCYSAKSTSVPSVRSVMSMAPRWNYFGRRTVPAFEQQTEKLQWLNDLRRL